MEIRVPRKMTVPGLLQERARKTPDQTAYRVKRRGIYAERTWSGFLRSVALCTAGMSTLGLNRFEHAALMADPCEEIVVCELAAQSCGATTYGMYPTASADELRYLLENGDASLLILENQEFFDRVLPLLDGLPRLRNVILINTTAAFSGDGNRFSTYRGLLDRGEGILRDDPEFYTRTISALRPEDTLFIAYTAGTTGRPKGVPISHGKHLAAACTVVEQYPMLAAGRQRTVVHLPFCHVLAKETAVTLPLLTDLIPHYAEDIEDMAQTFFETAPTVLITFPRFLQRLASSILSGIERSSPLKKVFFKKAEAFGREYIKAVWEGKEGVFRRSLGGVYDHVVFRPLLRTFGLDRLRLLITSDAPLSEELMTFWHVLGVNVSQCYTLAETGGAAVAAQGAHRPGPGHTGKPPEGWDVRIDNSGEILIKGPDLFEGYWKDAGTSRGIREGAGWFRTGDVGEWTAGGDLRILGRVQDMVHTPEGKRFNPAPLENCLKFSPAISEAAVFCSPGGRFTALVEVEPQVIKDWAQAEKLPLTDFHLLIRRQEVVDLINAEIEKANQLLPPSERIAAFRIIPKVLNPMQEGEPITPTRKIKRSVMAGRFHHLIEEMSA